MVESKPTLLFIDTTTPRPYDPESLEGMRLGGTEQTMVCLAEGLAGTDLFNVVVEQHNRSTSHQAKALYTSLGATQKARWVVVLRDPRPMLNARGRFRDAKIYLYSHDLATRTLGLLFDEGVFSEAKCEANICVSRWHKTQTVETLSKFGYTGQFRVKSIYNPIAEYAYNTSSNYDRNKLLWLASPHKGLDRAYELLSYLVKLNPDFKLYVTNPGYIEDQLPDELIKHNTVVLGNIPHHAVIQHLSNSLCLFYPNTVFPETFGKVMAEANAVGTPVLTSALGASREVLDSHPGQIVDCNNTEAVLKRVMQWWEGARPIVRGRPEFKIHRVLNEWVQLLQGTR